MQPHLVRQSIIEEDEIGAMINLIEEVLKIIDSQNWVKQNSPSKIKAFKELVSEIDSLGFQSNKKASALAMWIREELAKLAAEKNGYDLRVHSLSIPSGLAGIISERCRKPSNNIGKTKGKYRWKTCS